ncbi:MAG: hypothetical protein KAH44_23035 [Oricola sp.]|jgi:hypothetical protein|nr:hypothetical protein [Oricola sp.]
MKPLRIAMFSGPRNISTTMMRSFESRPDTDVKDEPLYGWYLADSGADHPMRAETLASMRTGWQEATADLREPAEGPAYVFEKHIAYNLLHAPDFDWLRGAKVFHLIRDPRAMIASYKNKYDDVRPIVDSYRVQRRLYEAAPAPVVDADDILRAPEKMLRTLCASIDIPFRSEMLAWKAGSRDSDGAWAEHWYDAVRASTGFNPYKERKVTLTPELEDLAQSCAEDYAFFHSRRLAV